MTRSKIKRPGVKRRVVHARVVGWLAPTPPSWEPSAWLRTRIQEKTRLVLARRASTCGHPLRRPVTVALWSTVVACGACSGRMLALSGPEDKTCDRCGGVVTGRIYPGLVGNAVVSVAFGLCSACRVLEGPVRTDG